ncbi:phosphate signaling complex protein PhoU [Lacrimispora sphenoides]|uniref:Phosphate-specific transport system accessory protein PhoU n=1 Tax=Lacrimispora sphenoides JCM 1415 TaxID=1297793 RepID=A0ABY1CA70_9FIRM|nr:phosphate signaling complex protein PhoU [Lacrimispora sphenoides]SET85500.1 phosphate transport system protein [[Clostridium] sphenoides JCM 1415]SUY51799.1 phosphate uptake regulator PhoU [Lacrimispora sphenoides]
MVRERFTQKILEVKQKVLKMGALVENIIDTSVTAMKTQDLNLARNVLKKDDEIDQLELEIEKDCMMLLALQQPLAKDLRTIASVLKIITDLERMGDNAVNIAEVLLEIGEEPILNSLKDIPRMADIAQKMLKMSLDAFVNEDIALAQKAAERDEDVDRLYETVINDFLNIIAEKRELTKQGTKLLFLGRYLERIADHSTNICERTIYMITGELKEIN